MIVLNMLYLTAVFCIVVTETVFYQYIINLIPVSVLRAPALLFFYFVLIKRVISDTVYIHVVCNKITRIDPFKLLVQ